MGPRKQWSLRSLFVVIGLAAILFAIMRVAGRYAAVVGIVGLVTSTIAILRCVFRVHPLPAAIIGSFAGGVAGAGFGFVFAWLTAFSPPEGGGQWFGGGGWPTVYLTTYGLGFVGLVFGFGTALICLLLDIGFGASIRFFTISKNSHGNT